VSLSKSIGICIAVSLVDSGGIGVSLPTGLHVYVALLFKMVSCGFDSYPQHSPSLFNIPPLNLLSYTCAARFICASQHIMG